MADYIFYVKVANSKFVLDSVSQATIALGHGITYRFDQSDSSNSGHPLAFSTTSDGTHNSGSAYTTGVTTNGTAGSSGAYVDIAVTSSTPASLYYYCSNHSGMGSAVITTGNTHVTTNNLGLLLPILANADDQWGSHINQSLRKIEDTFGANADVYTYNITGDTTTITGSATAGGTLAFNDGQHIEVYLNGVKLVGNLSSGNDYTLNASTNTITLASNAVNGDVVNIVVFKTFQFADAVPATGGTFTGTVSHSGTLDVSGGTLTTSTSQKTAIVDGGKGNLTKADVGLGNVTNDAQVPASGGTFSGDVVFSGNTTGVDVNGTELVLDADGDTSITADTDDQVDVKIAGTDKFSIDANGIRLGPKAGSSTSHNVPYKITVGPYNWSQSNDEISEITMGASSTGSDDGEIKFYTAQNVDSGGTLTERMRIDSAGQVGIGGIAPTSALDITGANNTSSSINLKNTAPNPDSHWQITPLYDSDTLAFRSGNNSFASRLNIPAGGGIEVLGGNVVIGTAGKGIDFSNQTDSPDYTPSAEILDHYEEGTWILSNNSGGFGYTSNGYYTRIGRLVQVQWEGTITGTANSGEYMRISGLPFSAVAWSVGSMYCQYYTDEGSHQLSSAVGSNSTIIRFIDWGNEALASKFQAGYFAISITYTTS